MCSPSGSDCRISFGVRRKHNGWKIVGHTDGAPRSSTRWEARKSAQWSLRNSSGGMGLAGQFVPAAEWVCRGQVLAAEFLFDQHFAPSLS